jgi:ABC-type Na+ efflux pump permease subunit
VLLFESGFIDRSTSLLAQNTHRYLANAIGVGASVEKTELNTVTAELTAARMELQREREINVGLKEGNSGNEKTVYILSGILFILLVLIVLNYVLDFLRYRERKLQQVQKTV